MEWFGEARALVEVGAGAAALIMLFRWSNAMFKQLLARGVEIAELRGEVAGLRADLVARPCMRGLPCSSPAVVPMVPGTPAVLPATQAEGMVLA